MKQINYHRIYTLKNILIHAKIFEAISAFELVLGGNAPPQRVAVVVRHCPF